MSQLFTSIPLEEFRAVISETVRQEVEKLNLIKTEPNPEFLTSKETAQILGVSLVTLHDWVKRGLIPCYRIASRKRYKKTEIFDTLTKVETLKYRRAAV